MRETDTERRETVHRAIRVLVVAWLAVMLVAAPAVAQTDTATPTPEGETAPCATGPPVPGQDNATDGGGSGALEVAIVSDRSASMSNNDKLQTLKNASTSFVDRLDAEDEAAAVSWADTATLDQQLTVDHQAVTNAINAIQADETGNNLDGGINTATTELASGANASEDASKVMIVATDGRSDLFETDAALNAAEDAKSEGITVVTIAIGSDADQESIQQLASGDLYYNASDPDALDSIYQEISGEVEAIGGDLEIDTRSLYQPGATHEYSVNEITYLENNRTTVTDVTENATVSTSNSTLLSVNDANNTLSATTDANTSTWVRVDATVGGATGCTNVIVAQPTVENLQLVPGIWRFFAVFDDSTMFALLIAALLSVPAARFTSAFGGLAVAEMTIVIGWVAGYIAFGFAAVSVFVALFIGLNLAANMDQTVIRRR